MPQLPASRLPHGESLGTYDTHDSARAAVAFLAEKEFDVSALSIIGSDVRIVETVRGLRSWGAAAGSGALQGAWLGLFLGLLVSLFSGDQNLTSGGLLPMLCIGVGAGIAWGLVRRALVARTGAVASQPQIVAAKYEIICASARASEARILLSQR